MTDTVILGCIVVLSLAANVALYIIVRLNERRWQALSRWMRSQECINRDLAQLHGFVFPPDPEIGWEPMGGATPNIHELIARDRKTA